MVDNSTGALQCDQMSDSVNYRRPTAIGHGISALNYCLLSAYRISSFNTHLQYYRLWFNIRINAVNNHCRVLIQLGPATIRGRTEIYQYDRKSKKSKVRLYVL